jgi:TonB family C-terminal domain
MDLELHDPDPSTMTNYYPSHLHLIGGLSGLQQSIQYPEFAQERRIEGRVFVEFVVDADGQPSSPHLTYGIHKLLNEEALRVVSQTDWVPAKQEGAPVRMAVTVPVNFRLDSTAAK